MDAPRRDVVVWDLPTRIFHWTMVLLVAINLFVISPKGGLHTKIHFLAGYAIASLLVFRLAWGFIGSRRSRFGDFVQPWPKLRAYLARLMRFDPPHSVGHNPVGGWMILGLLAMLLSMILTGLLAANRRSAGPLAYLMGGSGARLMGELHSLLSSVLIAFIIVHIGGVLVEWLLSGENLIRAMLNGRKRLPEAEAATEPAPAPIWRAAVLLVVAAAFGLWLAFSTDYARTDSTLGAPSGQTGASNQ